MFEFVTGFGITRLISFFMFFILKLRKVFVSISNRAISPSETKAIFSIFFYMTGLNNLHNSLS